jgi:hypothetical protein
MRLAVRLEKEAGVVVFQHKRAKSLPLNQAS